MNKNNIKNVVISVFASELTALFLLILGTLMTYTKPDPAPYSAFWGLFSLIFGGTLCAIISSFVNKREGISLPIISCGIYSALQFITTLTMGENSMDFGKLILKISLIMVIGILLAYMMKKKDSRLKGKHKKRSAKRR